jgi:hypothetical protein
VGGSCPRWALVQQAWGWAQQQQWSTLQPPATACLTQLR